MDTKFFIKKMVWRTAFPVTINNGYAILASSNGKDVWFYRWFKTYSAARDIYRAHISGDIRAIMLTDMIPYKNGKFKIRYNSGYFMFPEL